jgi:hypothetical protein
MLTKKATVLDHLPFTIEPERVLREMRVPHIKTIDQIEEKPLAESIKKAIDKAYGLIQGRGVFMTYQLEGVSGQTVISEEAGDLFTGVNMVKLLGGSDQATLLAATIGPGLEDEVERIQKAGELTDAYALEMVGGWMADYMADRVDEFVAREIEKKGYKRTMRFSPGYGDWSMENQPVMIRLSNADKVGITLTDTNIMIPRKSVTAVIGWERKS